jgi:hypothetical protein
MIFARVATYTMILACLILWFLHGIAMAGLSHPLIFHTIEKV